MTVLDKRIMEIKIFADDETLKLLGELLSNQVSRDIMKYLTNKAAYKNQIAKDLNIQFALLDHHLKKLEQLGLVKVTNKKIIKNGSDHKIYKMNSNVCIFSSLTKDEIEKKGIFKNIFRDSVKIASIGAAAIISYLFSINPAGSSITPQIGVSNPIIYPVIIVAIGLFVMYFKKKGSS